VGGHFLLLPSAVTVERLLQNFLLPGALVIAIVHFAAPTIKFGTENVKNGGYSRRP
jgi:hypothetical protein